MAIRATRRSNGWPMRSTVPSSPVRAAMPVFWPASRARRGSVPAILTPASSAHLSELGASPQGLDRAAAAAGTLALLAGERARIAAQKMPEPDAVASPWDADDGFQLSGARKLQIPILAEGEKLTAQVVQVSF